MDKTKCIAALFDFDGVVMDTETQYSIFWDEIGRQYFPQIKDFGRIITVRCRPQCRGRQQHGS